MKKKPGPVQVGPPQEFHATKASGKKFDLRSLPFVPPAKRERPEREAPAVIPGISESTLTVTPPSPSLPIAGPNAPAPAPLSSFDGLDFANWGAGHPPDTNGDVGPSYYIQTINTSIGVFRKSDSARVAAFTFNTFMSQGNFGNLCDTDNFGDPVVLYDSFEDRWIITDFAFRLDASNNVINPPGSFQCFAVSMSGDPVSGGWNYYSINTTGGLGDYPKLGIWSDGLYMSVNMFDYAASGSFQNSRLYALNKTQMYAGSPTVKVVSFDLPSDQFTVLPANARLQTGTPPSGSPNYFASVWNFLNSVQIWKFHVDWNNIPLSSVTGPFSSTMGFWWAQYSDANGTAPTPANANDTLYPRLMVQNEYSNIGGVESLWDSHTAGAGNPTTSVSSAQAAVRYYQVNVTGGSVAANTTQSFTYSPDATVFRYMPSAAVNRAGDMAIGYTTSNSTTNPGLKYAGRLAGDAANSITLTEQTLFQGTGSQSGTCGTTCTRWGDYSAMTLDPNGCTFWYTNEYYAANGLNHQTRIGSFVFPSCTPVGGGGTISGTVTATVGGAAISGATVSLGARTTTTNSSGVYSFTGIPAGTYPTLTASSPGFTASTSTSVPVTDGGTTTRNFSLASASSGSCLVDTSQADFNAGVLTNVEVTTSPGDVKLAKPDLLDQSNSQVNPLGFSISTTSWVAQTFTAAISGQLTRADVELFCNGCTTAGPNITVSIRATTGATPVPTGADLATATIAGFNDGGAGGLKTATFASPFTVTAGTRYAVVLRNSATFSTGTYLYTCSCAGSGFSSFNPYSAGQRATSSNSGTSWTADTTSGGRDLNFRVYVNAGYSTTGNFVSSVKDANPAVGNAPSWTTLSWTGTTPASTSLKFQVAGANSDNGPFNFVGPDGTAATFFTTSGASIAQFNGFRYLEYKALLGTTNTASTPTFSDATVCFSDAACGAANPTITPAPATVCPGATARTAAGPAGMANYSWSITNGTITSGLTSQTVTYTAGSSGTVDLKLTVTAAGGCVKTNTLSVPIDPNPTPAITPSGSATFCGSGTLISSAATGNQWYLNGVPIGGATSNTYNPTASGNYTVQATTANGCLSAMSAATAVTVTPTPPTPAASNTGPYCAGATIALSTPTVAGATYAWTGPNGFSSALQNPTRTNATTADAGTYSVTVTVSGCTSAAGTTNVVVNATPATPTASNGGPYCAGSTIALSTPAVAGATYAWTGPNGFSSALQNPTRANATTADAGTYSVTVTVSGCTSAAGTTSVVVNATPATPTASNGGPYCAGSTIALSTPTVAGATYAWTGPNGFSSALQNPARANATTADAGTYSVTITVSGCTSAAGTTSVVVNPIPATPTASNGGPYCAGATIQLSTPTVAGAAYAWTGPNGFASSLQNPTRSNATTADGGTYSVTVTTNGCTSAAGTTSVVVNPTPATPAAANGGPYCAGATIALSTPAVSGATYAWTGPNGFTSALQNPARSSATTADAGTYSVTITVSGCTSAAGTTTVVVNPIPATPTASNGGPYCEGATISLSTPTVAGAAYAWTGPNGFTSALQNPTRANAAVADAGTYSVTITVSGCTSAAGTTTVVVNATPATPTASNGGPYCEGATIQLSTPTVAGATYAWTGPNAFTSALQNPTRSSATTADAGIYSVTITVSGCTSAAGTTTVVINPTPATPTASNGGPYCTGAMIALSTPTVSGAAYAWTGPNGFISTLQNPTRSGATTADAGTYSVTITVNGCTSAAGSTNVVVNPAPATPTASNGGPYCAGATILLSTPAVSGAIYAWTGPNGFTSALQNPTRASATAADAGTYSVTITVSGCTSAAGTTNVVVNPIPATPTITPGGPTTFCTGGSVTLTSSSATGNQWFLNGNPIGGATNNTFSASAGGDYTVTVTASGCSSAASAATSVAVNTVPATPTITPAGSITFCFRDTVTLTSSSATGNQWSVEGTPLAGETGQTLLVTKDLINAHSANGSAHFTVTVTENSCSSTSAPKLVTVLVPGTPVIIAAGPTTFCTGGSVELDVTIDSLPGQWYLNGSPIGGATNSSYVATTSGSYTFVNTFYASCPSDPSNAIVVTVNPVPATPAITPGGPTTFCTGGSVTLTSSSASGNQWLLNGNPIGGATNNTYSATATGNYTVVVTASGCTSAASAATTVTVNPIPGTPTVTPMSATTFCSGGSVTLTSSAGPAYQWFLDGGPISGATNQTYSASATGSYTVQVTSGGCSATSSAQTVTVNPLPPTPTITAGGPTTMCGSGSVTLTSSSATGNLWINGGPTSIGTGQTLVVTTSGTYKVRVRDANGCDSGDSNSITVTFQPVPTADIRAGNGDAGSTTICAGTSTHLLAYPIAGATYSWTRDGQPIAGTTSDIVVNQAGSYTNTVTAPNGCSATSSPFVVNVNPLPATPTITPGGPTTFCTGGSVTLTSSSASGNQWFLNGNPIGGATNNTYSATASGNYTVVVTTSGCSSTASAATSVTVNPIPAMPAITPGGPTTFCTGGSVTLTSSSASGNQWFLNGNPIGGATNNTYSATASGNYTVTVTTNGCSSVASAVTSVTVNPIPAMPAITPGGPTTFCAGGSVTLTSSSASGNQWFLNGNPIGGATNNTYSATASGNYTVVVTASGCSSTPSSATSVTVNPIPATPAITGGPTTFCTGGNVTLTSNSASGNQWFLNGSPIGGAVNPTYVASVAGDYTVAVTTSGCTSASSSAKTVTINPTPNATITAPAGVVASSTGNTASVANAGAGATYNWSVTNGTITAGSGTTSITFSAGAVGTLTINVTVNTAAGCSDAKSANVNVTAAAPAVTVTSIAPVSGSIAGGTAVTINGTGFGSGATVTFGSTAATNVVVVSAIKITATTPAHAAGAVNVTVTNTNATSGTLTSGYLYARLFDPNGDGVIDPSDIFYLINYLFLGGPPPHGAAGMLSGDANGDGLVDPADIFYIVNYLFLGGNQPHAIPGTPTAASVRRPTAQIAGSLALGKAIRRGGHYVVPVILTSRGVTPQAMSLRVRFGAQDEAVGEVVVRRAGVAKDVPVIFETSRRSGNDVSYLVAYDPRGLALGASQPAVVAEIEIESVEGAMAISIDPQLTMLSDQSGTMKATVGNQRLEVSGTTIDDVRSPRPRVPDHEVK